MNDLKLPIKQNKCECKVCQFIRRYKEIANTLPNSEDRIFLMNHLDNFINLEEELGMSQEYIKDLRAKLNE